MPAYVTAAPPTLALPLKGGGNKIERMSLPTPSPSTGEGWGGGESLRNASGAER
jgi:hypothetical protein